MHSESSFETHWLCDSPNHYNESLFVAVAQGSSANLFVHFRNSFLPSHPWKTRFGVGYQNRVHREWLRVDWFLVRKALAGRRALFVFAGWNHPTAILLIALCIALNRHYAIWTDAPNIKRKRRWLFQLLRGQFLRLAFRHATAVLGTGIPALAALRTMGASESQLVNFPYWIDEAAYKKPAETSAPQSNKTLNFVSSGRLVIPLKGHDLAIRGLAKAFASHPQAKFAYQLAGDGPDLDALRNLAEHLGIGPQVHFLGWLEPTDLAAILRTSDVLIHPSPVHEPYGVAVIEAMAAGMVVMASDATTAAIDRIKHGINGLIHQAGDVAELGDQIAMLMQYPDSMAAMKQEARKTAEEWPLQRGVRIIDGIVRRCAAL